MNNTKVSPERLKEIAKSLRQPTPEEDKIMDEQVKEALKAANENMKAGRWANEREYQK